MKHSVNIEENILTSLDGIKKANVPDFFYTRLIGKMQSRTEDKTVLSFIFRPTLMAAALAFILLLNLYSLNQFSNQASKKHSLENINSDAFTDDFSMNNQVIY